MARLWKQMIKEEKGMALPIVLVLLVIGGLLIAPTLSYASTSLNAGQVVKKNVRGVYAADAGVEHALWCIKNDAVPPLQLPENINRMQVDIQTEDKGEYTLAYYGIILEVGGPHYDYLIVAGEMVWVEEAQAYKYTITVTLKEGVTSVIKLNEVGVRLPVGYSYQPGSAASFGGNLSIDEPNKNDVDPAGAELRGWVFGTPRPEIKPDNPVRTQSFYVTGEGELEGDYTWVVAQDTDIGTVGEVTGILYRITATATNPDNGEITATVMADAIWDDVAEEIRIILWQINPREE